MSRLHVTFIDKDGEEHNFEVSHGDNLLAIAQDNDLEMEGKLYTSIVNDTLSLISLFRGLRRIMRLLNLPRHCRRQRYL